MKGPVLHIFQLIAGEECRKDQEMKPFACKTQLTNGSIIIQVFDDFLHKFIQKISDGSVCGRSLSKRRIDFHLALQPSLHCGCGSMFHWQIWLEQASHEFLSCDLIGKHPHTTPIEKSGQTRRDTHTQKWDETHMMKNNTPVQCSTHWWQMSVTYSGMCVESYPRDTILFRHNRDAHGKDFRPIFNQFSLQFLFNFTANLTFFAVKLKENWNENWPKIGYHAHPGREILEKQVKIGSKQEPEGVRHSSLNGTLPCCR